MLTLQQSGEGVGGSAQFSDPLFSHFVAPSPQLMTGPFPSSIPKWVFQSLSGFFWPLFGHKIPCGFYPREKWALVGPMAVAVGRFLKKVGGGGGRFKCQFLKGFFCTDLCPNTLHRKCIKFAPKPTPYLRPWGLGPYENAAWIALLISDKINPYKPSHLCLFLGSTRCLLRSSSGHSHGAH